MTADAHEWDGICWTFTNPDGSLPDVDGYPIQHRHTEADIRAFLKELGDDPISQCIPQRLAAPCVIVKCAECGYFYDEDDEGGIHWESRDQAVKALAGDWTFVGEDAYCSSEECAAKASKWTTNLAIVEAFDTAHPVGTQVRYWRGVRQGDGAVGETTSKAWVLGGHSPVVRISGTSGAIALTHVQPLEVWDATDHPGGMVCATCGTPVESEPCAEHGAAAPSASPAKETSE